MGRGFILSQSNFSGGQITRNLSGNPSQELSSQAVVEARNVITENGYSLKKRVGFRAESLSKSDGLRFQVAGVEIGMFEEAGVGTLYYRSGDDYIRIPFSLKPDIQAILGNIEPPHLTTDPLSGGVTRGNLSSNAVNGSVDGISPVIVDDVYYSNILPDDVTKVSVSHNIAYITVGSHAYCIVNSAYNLDTTPFVIVPFEMLAYYLNQDPIDNILGPNAFTFNRHSHRNFLPMALVPKHISANHMLLYSLPSNTPNANFANFVGNLIAFPTVSLKSTASALILSSSQGKWILYPTGVGVTDPSAVGSALLKYYYAFELPFRETLPFSIDEGEPESAHAGLDVGNLLAVGTTGSTVNGVITTTVSLDDITFFESEWYSGNYPDGVSVDRRLTFFKNNQIWGSADTDVSNFFDYKKIVDEPDSAEVVSAAKTINIGQFRHDEFIVDIEFTNNFFVISNLSVWTKSGDLFASTPVFSNVSYKGGLTHKMPRHNSISRYFNNISLRVDGGVFYLNPLGELLYIDFNFGRSTFSTTNYSSILTFDGSPRFVNMFVLDNYNHHLFLVAEDGDLYIFYNRFENKVYNWTHLKLEKDSSLAVNRQFFPLGDKVYFNGGSLDLFNDDVYLDNYFDFGSVANSTSLPLPLPLAKGVDTNSVVVFIDGVPYPSLCNSVGIIDLSGIDSSVFPANKIVAGVLIDSNIKLFPLNPVDFDGSGYNQWKNVEAIELRVSNTKRLKIVTDEEEIISPISLSGNTEKDFIRMQGLGKTSEDYNININHKYNEPFKILGLTITGKIR